MHIAAWYVVNVVVWIFHPLTPMKQPELYLVWWLPA